MNYKNQNTLIIHKEMMYEEAIFGWFPKEYYGLLKWNINKAVLLNVANWHNINMLTWKSAPEIWLLLLLQCGF